MSGRPPEAAVLHVLKVSIHGQGAPTLDPLFKEPAQRQPGRPWKHVHTLIRRLPPWDQGNIITPAKKYLDLILLPAMLFIIAEVRPLSMSTEGLGDHGPQEVGEDGPHLPSG